MTFFLRIAVGLFVIASIACGVSIAGPSDFSPERFQSPPDSARPWVYWFWMDGNITEEGITADLEAMQRVCIGGVLIMEISADQPVGPVVFMSDRWRELFRHAVNEAARLGLELTMNAGPGWNGSGGPWITPAKSMQLVTISGTRLSGPGKVSVDLPLPKTVENFYRDITVLAFPTPTAAKAKFPEYNPISSTSYRLDTLPSEIAASDVVKLDTIRELKECMDVHGKFSWDAPEGDWTILRVGHTSKGMECSPAPQSGHGLECDKLSREGVEAAFDGMIGKLIEDNKKHVGTTFVRTHIDSWENGTQNWTPLMREEFQSRRGYDIVQFLPLFAGYIIESYETSDMFLWDLRRTISDLVYDNYFGRLLELSHENGLELSTEGYWAPSDQIPFAGATDEPMGEFWRVGAALETCRGMASAGHVYGKNIIGAEAFTAADDERWLAYPGEMKALGDAAFCEGINRFVFHRYAMQPWLNRWPGNSMGPYGIHFERTQTWWEQAAAWNLYLARCQDMLRAGRYVADICYMEPEESPQGVSDHLRLGYPWDQAGTDAAMKMSVDDDGYVTLPSGMKYRLLVLHHTDRMTPELAHKVEQLVRDGATIVGVKPQRSRGLNRAKENESELHQIADRVWGTTGGAVGEHTYGKGKVIWGRSPENILSAMGIPADIVSDTRLGSIHRRTNDSDIYFVVNPTNRSISATVQFRVQGRVPQFWNPVTGKTITTAVYSEEGGVTVVPMTFEPHESTFVVFDTKTPRPKETIQSIFHNGNLVASCGVSPTQEAVNVEIKSAKYGLLNKPDQTIDATEFLKDKVKSGENVIPVVKFASIRDPAIGETKHVEVLYLQDGEEKSVKLRDGETLIFEATVCRPVMARTAPELKSALELLASGEYDIVLASGKKMAATVPNIEPFTVDGAWKVTFPVGIPADGRNNARFETRQFERLTPWNEYEDDFVKHFSGTAVYEKRFGLPSQFRRANMRYYLDLGKVDVIAEVELNGKDLGIVWTPLKRIDVTDLLNDGENTVKLKVTNLWPNKMIGDDRLPEDTDRYEDGRPKAWPKWLVEGKSSPTGRETFTAWKLWDSKKALLSSGLIGPVQIVPTVVFSIGDTL